MGAVEILPVSPCTPSMTMALVYLIWLCAGFLSGLTGFGGNLIAIPLVMCLVEPAEAILQAYMVGASMCIFLCVSYMRHILWREIALLTAACIGGIPIGLFFLRFLAVKYIFLLAALVLAAFLLWQTLLRRMQSSDRPIGKPWAIPLGIASGFLNAVIGMGGPPMAVYAFMRRWQPQDAVGSMSFTGLATMGIIVPLQFTGGGYTGVMWLHAAFCGLAAGAGILLSLPVVARINAALFRRLLLCMIAFAACLLLFRFLGSA